MKTLKITQSRPQNDPINGRIQAFSFCDFENKVQCSGYDFFQFFQPILDFKHSSDAEMILKEEESRDSRIVVSKKFELHVNPRTVLPLKNILIL